MQTENVYVLKSVKLPCLAGGTLKAFVSLIEGPLRGLLWLRCSKAPPISRVCRHLLPGWVYL
jgi:hypothetical protein